MFLRWVSGGAAYRFYRFYRFLGSLETGITPVLPVLPVPGASENRYETGGGHALGSPARQHGPEPDRFAKPIQRVPAPVE